MGCHIVITLNCLMVLTGWATISAKNADAGFPRQCSSQGYFEVMLEELAVLLQQNTSVEQQIDHVQNTV